MLDSNGVMPRTALNVAPPSRTRRVTWATIACATFAVGASAQTGIDNQSPRNSFPDAGAPRVIERVPIFFPPNPPPLGRVVARGAAAGPRYPAPSELAVDVSEFFYPALGTRLATKTLPEKLRVQLDAYHAAKLALQNELRAELDRLRSAEPDARAAGLAALLQRQTPKIAALDKTAEQLRRDLITGDY